MRGSLASCVRVGVIAVSCLVMSGSASAASTSLHARMTVTPRTGSSQTSFTLRFRAPLATGSLHNVRREYVLGLSGPTQVAGCVNEGSLELPPSRAHANVKVNLRPRRFGAARWCPGTLHGQITVIEAPECPPREICPALVMLVGTVGTFTLHVRPPGGDATPPHFAGLTRATACTPGAQRIGEKTPAFLSWSPASDDRTPPSELVYDVFMATTPGSENFLQPTWTTAAGATSFRTPPLPSHAAAYFVVRARDRAGNEDANTVERPLVDPCV